MLVTMGMSLQDRLYTLLFCGSILAIAGVVYLCQKFKKHREEKKSLALDLQQKREEAPPKQNVVKLKKTE